MFSLLHVFLTVLFFFTIVQSEVLDVINPPLLQVRGDFSTDKNYILLITSNSTRTGNFFQFTNNTSMFPDIIKTYDLAIVSVNFTLSIDTLDLLANPSACSLTRNFIDCTSKDQAPGICSCFNQATDIDSCMNEISSQLRKHCTDTTTYLDVQLSVAQVELDDLLIASPGNLTFHYLNISSTDRNSWLVTQVQTGFWSFPLDNQNFIPTSSSSASAKTVQALTSNAQTTIKNLLVKHSSNTDIYCKYKLSYTGIIRGIYVNDYPSTSWSNGEDLTGQTSVISTERLYLKANEYNVLTIIGLNIDSTDLQFTDCRDDWQGKSLKGLTFQYSSYIQNATSSVSYTVQKSNIKCPNGCSKCSTDSICTACPPSNFLYNGQCLDQCPSSAPYPDYKGVCSYTFANSVILLSESVTDTDASIQSFIDQPDGSYLMMLHASDETLIGSTPLVWLTGDDTLSESAPQIITLVNGTFPQNQQVVKFISVLDSSVTDSDTLDVIYYPLANELYDMYKYEWTKTKTLPTNINTLSSPDSMTLHSTQKNDYITPTSFYIYETVLNCVAKCTINVVSDGKVTLIKNDRTVLFDVNFITKWQYYYTQTLTGTVLLQFQVSNGSYFKFGISSTSYSTYRKNNPIGLHSLSSLPQDLNACSIDNCNNCYNSICLSCNDGYFLSTDSSSCVPDCSPGKIYAPERKCLTACSAKMTDNQDGSCAPSCNYNAMIYDSKLGCQFCVLGCGTCASLTTCKACLFSNPLSNTTNCPRAVGSLYSDTPDFTKDQDVNFFVSQGNTLLYAAVVTDMSRIFTGVLYFMNPERQVPRFFGVYTFNSLNKTYMESTIPALSIAESGNITIHYTVFRKEPVGVFNNYTLIGFYEKNYLSWPQYEVIPKIFANSYAFEYNDPDTGLFDGPEAFATVIAQKMFTHNATDDLSCEIQIQYTGNIRGFYINDELIFADSSLNFDSDIKEELTKSYLFEAATYYYFTFTGYQFQIDNLSFENCINTTNDKPAVNAIFSSYLMYNNPGESDDFYVQNNTYCSDNCTKCLNSDNCLKCASGFYLQEGECITQCSDPYPYPTVLGYCDYTYRAQGIQLSPPNYDSIAETIEAEYNILLPSSPQIIAVALPFEPVIQSFPAMFPATDQVSLSEASFELITYTNSNPNVSVSLPVKVSASGDLQDANLVLYTTAPDLYILATYSGNYNDVADFTNPDTYEYVDMCNTTLNTTNKESTYYLSFFLECIEGSCAMSFRSDGHVAITANYTTFIFDALFDDSFPTYKLQRELTGITLLEIYVWGATRFEFNFKGLYDAFSYGNFILADKAPVDPTDPCPEECANCYQGACISCGSNQALTTASGTCGQCLITQYTLLEERLCVRDSCESLGFITSTIGDDSCTRQCPNNGFYYTLMDGCTNTCDKTCFACDGPTDIACLSCKKPRVYSEDNNSCTCPIGTVTSSNSGCKSVSYIKLSGDEICQSCTDYKLEASVRKDELYAYKIKFRWTLNNTTDTDAAKQAINSYLSTQNSRIIFIPYKLIKASNQYSFTVAYTNVIGDVFQASFGTWSVADFIPVVNIDGGNNQTITARQDNQITSLVTYSTCLDLSTPLQTSWSFVNGSYFNVPKFVSSQTPLKLSIPKCTLPANTTSTIKFKAWVDKYAWLSQTKIITITTLPDDFTIGITNGSREHPQDLDLSLSGYIVEDNSCSNDISVKYKWSCFKAVITYAESRDDIDSIESYIDMSGLLGENAEVMSASAGVNKLGENAESNEFSTYTDTIQFVACEDENGIFDKESLSPSLKVPSSYFDEGDVIHFRLTATKGTFTDSESTEIVIVSPTQLSLEITCSGNCAKYSNNLQYDFVGQILSGATGGTQNTKYTWTLDPFLPSFYYQNQFKINANSLGLDSSIDFVKLALTVQSGSKVGSSFAILPVNRAPVNGSLIIFPSTGTALSTYFSIVSEGWQDDDLPLNYQFSFAFSDQPKQKTLITDYQLTPQTSTILPGKSPSSLMIIEVVAKDTYGASSSLTRTVIIDSNSTSLAQSIAQVQNTLSSLGDYDPLEKLKVITVLNSNINQLEEALTADISNTACPICSGNGVCWKNITRCVCDAGWTLADCSLPQDQYDAIINFRLESLQDIQNISQVVNDSTAQEMLLNALKVCSQSEVFNNNQTLSLVQDVLEDNMNILSNSTNLGDTEAQAVAEILSNMMSYASLYDCAGNTNFTAGLRNKTNLYLNKIGQSAFANLLPGENYSVITTDNFDILSQKLKLCNLTSQTYSMGDSSPDVKFTFKDKKEAADCSSDINLQYYSFSQGLLDCSINPQSDDKSHIAIIITNGTTGEEIDLDVSISINYPSTSDCPSQCTAKADGSCFCDNVGIFDVIGQLDKIFTVSNLKVLFNIKSLLSFAFWETSAFWTLIVLTIWYFATLYVVRYKWADYDAVEKFKNRAIKTKIIALRTSVQATHPLLNVYYVNTDDLSKAVRAAMYYNRTILLLAFTSIFTEDVELDNPTFQLLDFNAYLLFLPYFTIIPIGALTEWLIKNPTKETLENASEKRRKFLKWKNRFGYLFTNAIVLGCLLAITIVLANQSDDERMAWTYNFLQSFLQDMILTPALFLATQYFYLRMLENPFIDDRPRFKKMIRNQIDESLWELKECLLGFAVVKVVPMAMQAVRNMGIIPAQITEGMQLRDQSRTTTETKTTLETETSGNMESLQRMAELYALTGHQVRGPIQEESYEDSPGLETNRNRILDSSRRERNFTGNEVLGSRVSRFNRYAKQRIPVRQPTSLQDEDLDDNNPLDTSIERNRKLNRQSTIFSSRLKEGGDPNNNGNRNERSKPGSWHDGMDSGLLTTVSQNRAPSSLNALKTEDSPQNTNRKSSPTSGSDSRRELLFSPTRSQVALNNPNSANGSLESSQIIVRSRTLTNKLEDKSNANSAGSTPVDIAKNRRSKAAQIGRKKMLESVPAINIDEVPKDIIASEPIEELDKKAPKMNSLRVHNRPNIPGVSSVRRKIKRLEELQN